MASAQAQHFASYDFDKKRIVAQGKIQECLVAGCNVALQIKRHLI